MHACYIPFSVEYRRVGVNSCKIFVSTNMLPNNMSSIVIVNVYSSVIYRNTRIDSLSGKTKLPLKTWEVYWTSPSKKTHYTPSTNNYNITLLGDITFVTEAQIGQRGGHTVKHMFTYFHVVWAYNVSNLCFRWWLFMLLFTPLPIGASENVEQSAVREAWPVSIDVWLIAFYLPSIPHEPWTTSQVSWGFLHSFNIRDVWCFSRALTTWR